jgi:hypothetical protein
VRKQTADQEAIRALLRDQRADEAWEKEMATKSGSYDDAAAAEAAGHPIASGRGQVGAPATAGGARTGQWCARPKLVARPLAGQRACQPQRTQVLMYGKPPPGVRSQGQATGRVEQQTKEKRERERLIKRTVREVKQGDTQAARLRRQYDKPFKQQEERPTKLRDALEKMRKAVNQHIQDIHDKRLQIEVTPASPRDTAGEAPTSTQAKNLWLRLKADSLFRMNSG